MTSETLDLETRRRRLKFRAWHRGIKELDLIFGNYVDDNLDSLSKEDCMWFERLFEENDQEVLTWITGREATPEKYQTDHFSAIRAMDGKDLRTL